MKSIVSIFLIATLLVIAGYAGAEVSDPGRMLGMVKRISPEDVKTRLDKGEKIMIVDVRSLKSFETQHIVGAVSIPLSEVELSLSKFPKNGDIVFY
jgi:hypothetical protein